MRGWNLLKERSNPTRCQAKRTIDAFESYGVARQQIARLLPEQIELPAGVFSTVDSLKACVSPPLLDWSADFLALNRAWFDCVDAQPHLLVDGYKDTSVYERWLASRIQHAPAAKRHIVVWKSHDGPIGYKSPGHLSIAYIENDEGLDGSEFARYWMFSRDWLLGHPACVEAMLALVSIAKSQKILMTGRLRPTLALKKLERGEMFASQVDASTGKLWYPEDAKFVLD